MKILLSVLKKIIAEEVEKNLMWSAGFGGGGDSKGAPDLPPPGLGDEKEKEDKNGNKKRKEKLTQRYTNISSE